MRSIARFALLVPCFVFAPAIDSFAASRIAAQTTQEDDSDLERAELDKALARAAKENRRVLVQWVSGGGGHLESRLLDAAMRRPDVRRKLMYEYDVVTVDSYMFHRGMRLAKELGFELDAKIPRLVVLDASRNVLANADVEGWLKLDEQQSHTLDEAELLEFLTQHQAPYLDASKVRDAAFARAKAENKRVFLHFGAPWCGWCHRLEAWMERPEVAPLLAKQFVDLKIDTDRMIGGADMLKAARSAAGLKEEGGIPWFAFYDAEGKPLESSEGPKGNVGYPYQDDEIAHFARMLEAARTNLSDEDIAKLRDSLAAVRREDEARKAAEKAKKEAEKAK